MNKHFLFIVGAPALLVLVILVAGMYRFTAVDESAYVAPVIGNNETSDIQAEGDLSNDMIDTTNGDPMMERRIVSVPPPPDASTGKLKVGNFIGKLEKVDVGCFADGECFVEIDGKHITAMLGWRQEVVGSVQGVEGFGDLESHIGEYVEVYAQDKGDGTYTLYGSEGFYLKLLGKNMPQPEGL